MPVLRILMRVAGAAAVGCLLLLSELAAGSEAPASISASAAASTALGGLPLRRVDEPVLPAGGIGMPGLILLGALATVSAGWALWRQRRTRAGGLSPLRQLLAPQRDGVSVVQSITLTPQASVHVIEWNGHQHLVACGGGAVTALADRDRPATNPTQEERR